MKYTTKTVYSRDAQWGSEYACHNVSPCGTKWRIRLKSADNNKWLQYGTAQLLDCNWEINEEKLQETEDFLRYEMY